MSPELSQPDIALRTPKGDAFIIHDGNDHEAFPVRDLNEVLELPSLLEPNSRAAAKHREMLEVELRIAGLTISNASLHAATIEDYLSIGGSVFITKQRELRNKVLSKIVNGDESRYTGEDTIFTNTHEQIFQLAPAELTFWAKKIEEQNEITIEDYIGASQLDKPSFFSRLVQGGAGRLEEVSEESQQKLLHIHMAYNTLLLLQNHSGGAEVLQACVALGDRRQVGTALSIFARLKNISCDPQDYAYAKMGKQYRTIESAHRLAAEICGQQSDKWEPEVRRKTLTLFRALASELNGNFVRSQSIGLMLASRDLRLHGNRLESESAIADEVTLEEQSSSDTHPDVTEKKVATSKLPEYLNDLQPLLEQAKTITQPELLAAKEIKRRGLDKARAVLVKGKNDKDGNLIISGRSKTEAQQDISTIEFVRSFITRADNLVQAKEAMEQAVKECNQYLTDIETFLGKANDDLTEAERSHLKESIPAVGSLQGLLEVMRQEWPATEYLLQNYWPNKGQAAEQLRKLLFMTSQELAAELEQQDTEEPEIEEITEPVALPIDEVIEINPLEAQSELAGIAKQLDEIILPPHATHDDVKRVIEASGLSIEQAEQIDWTRLYNLVTLREQNSGIMYRSKDGDLGNAPPYFVVTIGFKGDTYAVAESPVEGNATYIISEKDCPGTWLEVLQLDKASARELGARRIIHRAGKATPDHLAKIQDVLIDLAIPRDLKLQGNNGPTANMAE